MNKSAFSLNIDGIPSSLVTSCNISAAFVPGKDLYLPSKQYAAIWDTGATGTVISDRVVQELGLKPSGVGNVFTASSGSEPVRVNTYSVNVILPSGLGVAFVRVTEGKLNGFDVLIGMDIIMQGDFSITHKDGKTLFSFQIPSTHHFDFVDEIKQEKK